MTPSKNLLLVGMKVINNTDTSLGIGTILKDNNRSVEIKFVSADENMIFSKAESNLERIILKTGDKCEIELDGEVKVCSINECINQDSNDYYKYTVIDSNNFTYTIEENKLNCLSNPFSENVVVNLINLRVGSPKNHFTRSNLLEVVEKLRNKSRGLHSLVGARLKPYPHQAFVASKVLRNSKLRFILADEVGLGKTIEAGLILQNLLISESLKKILILAPETLTFQWFCEMYIKFGNTVFTFLNEKRYNELGLRWLEEEKVICSFELLNKIKKEWANIITTKWELIIIDEVHNIKPKDNLFLFIKELSMKNENLLMLSATPITGREERYLNLLRIFDPLIYEKIDLISFKKRLSLQKEISELLMLSEDSEPDEYLTKRWLNTLPNDPNIKSLCKDFTTDKQALNKLVRYVENYYKINRRVLRNRRQSNRIVLPQRDYQAFELEPTEVELPIYTELGILISEYKVFKKDENVKIFITYLVQSSTSSPMALEKMISTRLDFLKNNRSGKEFVNFSSFKGEAKLLEIVSSLCRDQISNWLNSAKTVWLNDFCEKFVSEGKKLLIFTTFPETLIELIRIIQEKYGVKSVAEFHKNLSNKVKDENALKFITNKKCSFLISDELGGEGRNFQMADGILHFDLPFEYFLVEQRIGRLDRLGRKEKVVSYIPYYNNWYDKLLIEVYKDGINIFNQSSSGLEFIYPEIFEMMVEEIFEGKKYCSKEFNKQILEKVNKERQNIETDLILDRSVYDPIDDPEFEEIIEVDYLSSQLRKSVSDYAHLLDIKIYNESFGPKTISYRDTLGRLTPYGVKHDFTYKGTFDRDLAITREDLIFFSVGNEFVDAVIKYAKEDIQSGACLVKKENKNISWRGFRFIIKLSANYKELEKYKIGKRLIHDADFALPPEIIEIFVKSENKKYIVEKNEDIKEYLLLKPSNEEVIHFKPEEIMSSIGNIWQEFCVSAWEFIYDEIIKLIKPKLENILVNEFKKAKADLFMLETLINSMGNENVGFRKNDLEEEKKSKGLLLKSLKTPQLIPISVTYFEIQKV